MLELTLMIGITILIVIIGILVYDKWLSKEAKKIRNGEVCIECGISLSIPGDATSLCKDCWEDGCNQASSLFKEKE